MSETIKQEDLIEKTDVTPASTEQDPLKVELDRVQKTGKSEAEKATFSLKKNAERVRELGIDPAEILGIRVSTGEDTEIDEDKPVTVGMLKRIQQESAAKSALQLADDIGNESERELTKYHLQNSIRSTGNPSEDLRLARSLTNAAKNGQILDLVIHKPDTKNHSTGSGGPLKVEIDKGELTAAEMKFLGKPFKMTKEEIIKARG